MVLVHSGAEGLLLYLRVADLGRLAVPLVRDQIQVLAFGVAGRGWLGRAERLDRLAGAAAAQFGVGGDGQLAGLGGDCSQSCRRAIAWAKACSRCW